jgi:hypothetical protein
MPHCYIATFFEANTSMNNTLITYKPEPMPPEIPELQAQLIKDLSTLDQIRQSPALFGFQEEHDKACDKIGLFLYIYHYYCYNLLQESLAYCNLMLKLYPDDERVLGWKVQILHKLDPSKAPEALKYLKSVYPKSEIWRYFKTISPESEIWKTEMNSSNLG